MGYRTRFIEVDYSEPHKKRTEEILKKYPQIKDLYGPCPRTKYIITAVVLFQFFMAYTVSSWSWTWTVVAAWAISGTLNHMMSLATHELSHNLAFEETWKNDVLGNMCNMAMGVPSIITFRKYHMEHHRWQGVVGIDTDIPSAIEGKVIGNNPLFKLLFLMLQPAFYALRPMLVRPKRKTRDEWINLATVLLSDALVLSVLGPKGLFYIIGGTLLGLSIHPTAGHFLAEHYVWDEPTETYSYYGPLNVVAWNVGYHVEHHDFPRVPGSRLPQLREIAKEYYPINPKYQSWVGVMVRFVLDPNMGIYNRVTRKKSD